jgi:teichoic acid transport system permease protein
MTTTSSSPGSAAVPSSTAGYSDVEYVFEPHSRALPNIPQYIAALWDRRTFMVALARSDLRTARKSTALGSIWTILDPLFQAGVYFFLYTVIRGGGSKGGSGATSQQAFLPVLIAGFFLFALSTAAINDGGGSIKRSKGLMLNSTFPRAMLPMTSVYKSLRKFVPCAFILVIVFPLTGGKIGPGLFVLPLLFALQLVMNVGISMLSATFLTMFSDSNNVVSYINRLLFFATPVVYPVTLLPSSAKLIIGWQPLFALFASYQAIFTGGVPSLGLLFQVFLWAFFLLIVGGNVFLRHEREFTLHL